VARPVLASAHCTHWNCTRREAQALAALNHPHIAAIYDVIDLADHRAIVMELVSGTRRCRRAFCHRATRPDCDADLACPENGP
jgi:hypothetical protein